MPLIFITLTKDAETEWDEVVFDLKKFLKIYFDENQPVFAQKTIDSNTLIVNPNDGPVVAKIKATLDQYVRPAVESDGGAINFSSYDEESGLVKVFLQGSCSGCPSSMITLKSGIEGMMKRMIPEVKEVVAEALQIHSVVGRSKQLLAFAKWIQENGNHMTPEKQVKYYTEESK